jgi:Domain of unknown function (DUF4328)/GYF domain 2
MNITIARGSDQFGPYTLEEVQGYLASGHLAYTDLYWTDGMIEWRPLSEYFQVAVPHAAPVAAYTSPRITYTKDPASLTRFVIIMLWVTMGFEIVSILSDIGQMLLLNRPFTPDEGTANDARQGLIGVGYMIVFIVTGVAFLKWIHRANLNCRGFGAANMVFAPGWAVGWYFIPFMNLVRPFQAMKEIWQASQNPRAWQSAPGSPLLGWWWGLWVANGVLGQVVFRAAKNATTIEQLERMTTISIVASIAGIPLCLVAIKLIKSIAAMQERVVKNG